MEVIVKATSFLAVLSEGMFFSPQDFATSRPRENSRGFIHSTLQPPFDAEGLPDRAFSLPQQQKRSSPSFLPSFLPTLFCAGGCRGGAAFCGPMAADTNPFSEHQS